MKKKVLLNNTALTWTGQAGLDEEILVAHSQVGDPEVGAYSYRVSPTKGVGYQVAMSPELGRLSPSRRSRTLVGAQALCQQHENKIVAEMMLEEVENRKRVAEVMAHMEFICPHCNGACRTSDLRVVGKA